MEQIAICAVFSPLIGFFIAFIGKKIKNLSESITLIMMISAVSATAILWWKTNGMLQLNIHLLDWIDIENFKVSWGLRIDPLTMIMLGVVNLISLLVHVYSLSYMAHDPSKARFMAYLSFFTFMMLLLVTAPNMVQLFAGWEGVGVASYLLIGFWYERPKAALAATKAFVVNRIGDAGLILAMGGLYFIFDTLEFKNLLISFSSTKNHSFDIFGYVVNAYDLIGLFLVLGAMGKSAQFGLHIWLPDAMEGPTPVSALIHAATMVTAGVFLIVRFSPLFELAPLAKEALLYIGIFTAFFAGTVALTQNDIKRIIAYSTCSQLGYMMAACGCGAYSAAIFHLTTHAFFKALLFLCAGSVIHAMSDEQDIQKMGGIARLIPKTYGSMLIGSLALSGIPFFSGYYSKNAILEAIFNTSHPLIYFIALIVVFLTSFYSWRLLCLVFHGKPKANEHVMAHVHESNYLILIPLGILSIGALFSGWLGNKYLMEQIGFSWLDSIFISSKSNPDLPLIIHSLPLLFSIFGIGAAIYLYLKKSSYLENITIDSLYQFSLNKWWVDEFYSKYISSPLLKLADFLWQIIDKNFIDRFGPNGITQICLYCSRKYSKTQTGYIYHYALSMSIGLILLSILFLIYIL